MASVDTQNRPVINSWKTGHRIAGAGTLTAAVGSALAAVANVLSIEKRGQVIALGRLGWSLRRIEETTGVRRETSAYLKAVGLAVRARAADRAAAKTGHRGVDRPRAGGEQNRPGGVDRVDRPDAILYLLAQSLLDLASDHLMGTAT